MHGEIGVRRERERLLAAVRARCERFSAEQDPRAVLDPAALAEVAALVRGTTDPAADLEVAHAAGWLHWCRSLVLDRGSDERDLSAALLFLEPVYDVDPDAIPEQVRAYFDNADRPGRSTDVEAVANRAAERLQHAMRSGDPAELAKAIDLLREALRATPRDHADRAGIVSNLGGALQYQFETTDRLEALDEAIKVGREAVAATPPGHPNRPAVLSNLGLVLKTRFARTGRLEDIDDVISVRQEAVAAADPKNPKRAMYLSDLGVAFMIRFETTGRPMDLDEAIRSGRDAVATLPDEHPSRATLLSNLSLALRARYDLSGRPEDLDEVIALMRDAAAATPPEH